MKRHSQGVDKGGYRLEGGYFHLPLGQDQLPTNTKDLGQCVAGGMFAPMGVVI